MCRFHLAYQGNSAESGLLIEICEAASGLVGKFTEIICICHIMILSSFLQFP